MSLVQFHIFKVNIANMGKGWLKVCLRNQSEKG